MIEELLDVVVRKRELQGDGVVVLDLIRRDGAPLPVFDAGAHVDLHIGPGLVRQYSLCGNPADPRMYRLGVLKDPASRGGSVGVHEYLLEGRQLQISAPRNLFPLAADAYRSLLLGGGIGITPMIAMAYSLHAAGKAFELHYCGRERGRSAFLAELAGAPFAANVFTHFDNEGAEQRLDLDKVLGQGEAGVHLYTCGPAGFMDWVIQGARDRGYTEAHIHKEYFQVEVDSSGGSFEVVAARSGKTVQVAEGQSILAALAQVGIKIEISCEQGVCGTCLCDVLEGEPDHRDVYLTDDEKAGNDQILVCCSRAKSKNSCWISEESTMVDVSNFRNAMAMLGGAVSVITTDGVAGRFGFTASAVCSVTDSPPTLLVCMNRSSHSNEHFKRNGAVCVNTLCGDHQQLSGAFADRTLTMDERFAVTEWTTLESGAPVMLDALVNFDCRIVQVHEVGSHSIFYCEIQTIRQSGADEGLVYFNRAYHRLGEASKAC